MAEETKKEIGTEGEILDEVIIPPAAGAVVYSKDDERGARGRERSRGRRPDRKPKREPRAKPEFDQRIIDIRRVTRVASGGRRFSFSVALVVGNRKGSVAVATGKASDTALAIEKAYRAAKKKATLLNLTSNFSLPHPVSAKFKSARIEITPARGKGVVAGSSARDVIELAGIKDVNSKLRSPTKNKLNIARATIKALQGLRRSKSEINAKQNIK